jgi:hypothetical protein
MHFNKNRRNFMKYTILLAVAMFSVSSFAIPAKPSGKAAKAYETLKLSEERKRRLRGEAADMNVLRDAVSKVAATLESATSMRSDMLVKLMTNSNEAMEAIVTIYALKDSKNSAEKEKSKLMSMILDSYAREMEMDKDGALNTKYNQILEAVNMEYLPQQAKEFLDKVILNKANKSLERSLNEEAEVYAKEKGWTVEKWLEEFFKLCMKKK